MRDDVVYGMVNELRKMITQTNISVRTALTGEALQNEALKRVLIKKNLLTETEWTQIVGEVIQELNAQPDPEVKKELVTPTATDVANVEATKIEDSTSEVETK